MDRIQKISSNLQYVDFQAVAKAVSITIALTVITSVAIDQGQKRIKKKVIPFQEKLNPLYIKRASATLYPLGTGILCGPYLKQQPPNDPPQIDTSDPVLDLVPVRSSQDQDVRLIATKSLEALIMAHQQGQNTFTRNYEIHGKKFSLNVNLKSPKAFERLFQLHINVLGGISPACTIQHNKDRSSMFPSLRRVSASNPFAFGQGRYLQLAIQGALRMPNTVFHKNTWGVGGVSLMIQHNPEIQKEKES